MAEDDGGSGGGFGWGLLVGIALGVAVGAWLATGPGRDQMSELTAKTIELGGSARRAAADPESPFRRAVQEGVAAARRRRAELERSVGSANVTELETNA